MVFNLLSAEHPWGTDSQLNKKIQLSDNRNCPDVEYFITFHQKILSPTDGPRSHFYPVSSTYSRKALRVWGYKGWLLACDRLLRENQDPSFYPLIFTSEGWVKYDPVPEKQISN